MMEKQLVPQLRFPEFKGVWEKNKIGDVSRIYGRIGYRGYTVQDIVEKGEGAITLSPSNFIDNHIDISKSTYISWDKYEESPEIKIYNRDILFVKTGSTFGKTAFVKNLNEPATINPQIVVLKDIDIHNEFLGYVISLPQIRKQVESIVVGGAIPTMSQKELSKMIFSVPSLPEQQKIASFLTDVDAKITQLTKKKDLLEQYKKGVMQKIFNQELRFKDENGNAFPDWKDKKLGELTSLITKGTTPTSLGFSYLKEGINFIKVECINNTGFIDVQSTPKVSQECNTALKRSELKINDILFSIAGTLGRTALVMEKDLPANTNQALAIVRLKSGVNLSFINYSLNTENIEKFILKMVSVGAQPNLNLQQVGDITINLPIEKEQTKIANFLSDIDVKIEALNIKIENSKSFKKGLLQQMFV